MTEVIHMTGRKFGRFLVLSRAANGKKEKAMWNCRCDCGTEKAVDGALLRSGRTQSCGCYVREVAAQRCRDRATHGGKGTVEYSIWIDMRRRCSDPSRDNYKSYGAKGIKVCPRWKTSFSNFLADVGPRPSSRHTLDRKDSKGDYEPGNCQWADDITQANNRSNNRIVEYRGEHLTVANALRRAGSVVKKSTALKRLASGWTVEAAVETRV